MTKRRVTFSLDEDLVAALEQLPGRSLSAIANEALRAAVAADGHRRAVNAWLDELDALRGPPTDADRAAVDAFFKSIGIFDEDVA